MLKASTLQFLSELRKNNERNWFEAHRNNYENARQDFTNFIQGLIQEFGKSEPVFAPIQAKNCLFRINRDIRFSKDKSPYKTNFGAYINPEGKKSIKAGYYFHCEPGGSYTGGGLWMPEPGVLANIRQEIDYNLPSFEKIIKARPFREIYGNLSAEDGQLLTRVPKGYEPDNPAAEYLKFKSFVALTPVSDDELRSPGLTKKALKAFLALRPLIGFLNEGIE